MFAFAFENISILLPLNICSRIQRREEECHVSRDVCHACPACEAGARRGHYEDNQQV